jgi:hypothetical protein
MGITHVPSKEFQKNRGRGEREGTEWVVREGVGARGRNDPSIVCTYE